MIIARAPLRLSLGGGGTDLPEFYKKNGSGLWFSIAIDKYIYISFNQKLGNSSFLRYSQIEELSDLRKSKNRILSAIFNRYETNSPVEFTSHADIPSGTGLGSSGTFTVASLAAIKASKNLSISKYELAEEACDIEINDLQSPSGKQDQYIAAYGGLRKFKVDKAGNVLSSSIGFKNSLYDFFYNHIVLIYTDISRSANDILEKMKVDNNLYKASQREIAIHEYVDALLSENHIELGKILDAYWSKKRVSSANMSSSRIDELYSFAKNHGGIGGKVVGAGGGGFIMMICESARDLIKSCSKNGIKTILCKPDIEGVKIIENDFHNFF